VAQAKVSFADKIVGLTVRNWARVLVATSDIEKIKGNIITQAKGMEQKYFKEQRAKAYSVAKELPDPLKKLYGIRPNMTKEDIVRAIGLLDKGKIYDIIGFLSDQAAARAIRESLDQDKQLEDKRITFSQVKTFFRKINQKVKRK